MDIQKFPSIIILSTFLIFLFMVVKRVRSKPLSSNLKLPPGPWKLPLIGNLHNMLGLVPVAHRTLANLVKKYGPLMQLQLGEVPILVVSSPTVAKQIVKNHDFIFADMPEFYAGKILFYNSTDLAVSRYGDYWRDMRKNFVMYLLSAKHMQLFRPLREEEVSNMIKTLSLQAGAPVNLSKRVTSMFSTITSRAAFRDSSKVSEDDISMIGESLTSNVALTSRNRQVFRGYYPRS
ncbi:cytochrome P450 71D9-like [Papaver somniferum]|uniref:cytochrome P450 71D9-like n=1 Tax=Papaver somniferum TaxID=3469 RepID=UPI000E701FF5|nr:cytochrome P450 71D9-like [Papaver somniferum]